VGAGSALYASGLDIDGQPWGVPPCIGADQLVPGAATGPLSVALATDFTNVTVGYSAYFRAQVEGQTTGNRWDFGDGTLFSNRLETVHDWQTPGTYPVRLTVFNDAYPDGVTATVTVQVVEVPVSYANLANPSPAFPYTSWTSAASNIQDAIGASDVAGRLVLVTNGVYDTGGVAVWGQMTNRIALTHGVVVRSVNGPAVTILRGAPAPSGTNGDGAIRCAYVGDGSVLDGFTLTNGHTRASGHTSREQGGGGAWCERTGVVTNCVFIGNEAFRDGGGANGGIFHACTFRDNRAGDDSGGVDDAMLYDCILTGNQCTGSGGGTSESALYNCTLTGNSATGQFSYGGGASDGTLNNCTLTGNSAVYGGGASDGTLYNCKLTSNSASELGGGAQGVTLYNCTLTANSASWAGGGASDSTLNNCTLSGNSATFGGGARYGILNNCIVYYNTAAIGSNYWGGTLNHCCTFPLPSEGAGNITNEPAFVDYAGGNLRLQSNSPCINAGNNAYTSGETDLDGLPRIVGGTVDIGPYEFQAPASLISYAWLQQYGLPLDGSADTTDPDGDRLNNWQEWRCGTDPTNASSVLRLLTPLPVANDVNVSWLSAAGVSYFLERSTNLAASPPFLPLATNLTGQAGTTTFTDTNAIPSTPAFYRISVTTP
jgi:PKD repeat protein